MRNTFRANNSVFKGLPEFILRKVSWVVARRKVKLAAVEGLEHVSCTGPVLIVARHYHHLYDGCVLMKAVPRRLHIIVALDSVRKRWIRRVMEFVCSLVDWPIVLRAELLNENIAQDSKAARAYSFDEAKIYLRRALKDSVRLLRDGEALVVFPEAYPDIDPRNSARIENGVSLPFRQGFARLVEMAERDQQTTIAIVPAGLSYVQNRHWNVTLRFGQALSRSDYIDALDLVQDVEKRVRELSDQVTGTICTFTEETIKL